MERIAVNAVRVETATRCTTRVPGGADSSKETAALQAECAPTPPTPTPTLTPTNPHPLPHNRLTLTLHTLLQTGWHEGEAAGQ